MDGWWCHLCERRTTFGGRAYMREYVWVCVLCTHRRTHVTRWRPRENELGEGGAKIPRHNETVENSTQKTQSPLRHHDQKTRNETKARTVTVWTHAAHDRNAIFRLKRSVVVFANENLMRITTSIVVTILCYFHFISAPWLRIIVQTLL